MLNHEDHVPNPFHLVNFTRVLPVWEKHIRGRFVMEAYQNYG